MWQGKGEGKGNVDLYSAASRTPLTRSDMDHTVLHANNAISPLPVSIVRRRHHAYTHSERLSSTYYSFIDAKRMNG